jgi:hypothetical protein
MLRKLPFDYIEDHVLEQNEKKTNELGLFAIVVADIIRQKVYDG